jgi:Family of unknown function (DUF5670)
VAHGLLTQMAPAAWGRETTEEVEMLWTIVVILAVLWLLGMVTSNSAGGLIHILLVLAIIVVLFNVIQGRRAF